MAASANKDGVGEMMHWHLIRDLLSKSPAPDVNHYDRQGYTVLMTLITHIPDEHEDKFGNLEDTIKTLLETGAHPESRNRRGETALLVAARLGRKIALRVLLDSGANVHACDIEGHGVLEVIDTQCRNVANKDIALYGRLEACRVLLTNINRRPLGVKQRPGLLDEWGAVCERCSL